MCNQSPLPSNFENLIPKMFQTHQTTTFPGKVFPTIAENFDQQRRQSDRKNCTNKNLMYNFVFWGLGEHKKVLHILWLFHYCNRKNKWQIKCAKCQLPIKLSNLLRAKKTTKFIKIVEILVFMLFETVADIKLN